MRGVSHFSAPDAKKDETPRPASTIILVRAGPFKPEVFLLERHGRSAFLGGAYVFPGGKVDPEDAAHGEGFAVAGVRETFEEAGVLLARARGTSELHGATDGLRSVRRALNEKKKTWSEFVTEEDLALALDQLVPFAHWITPSAERRRFDTRFFLAALPEGQIASADETETVKGVWLTAEAAIDAHERREFFLAPPTYRVLEELAAADTVEAAIVSARSRAVHPLLPKIRPEETGLSVLLAWHPDYAETDGEGLPVPEGAPERAFAPILTVPPPERPEVPLPDAAREILTLWFGEDLGLPVAPPEVAQRWWAKNPEFDAELRTRFEGLHAEAASGQLDHWQATPEGTVALVVLLDQLSRNMFRGDGRAFATDGTAQVIVEQAILRGDDRRVSTMLRSILYMPLMHAEDMRLQEASLVAFERLAESGAELLARTFESCRRHYDIVARFGRYPFRNEPLGRPSTDAEIAWMAENENF